MRDRFIVSKIRFDPPAGMLSFESVTTQSPDDGLILQRLTEDTHAEITLMPPFPRHVNVELSNTCNHSCTFCAYSLMERTHGNINIERLERWLAEAYDLGSRELGLHSGAEPFVSPHLEHFTGYAKRLGYEYVYISTNASLATPARMKRVIDEGMDSIKFSINAGDRQTYQKIHGRDHFDLVLEHVRFASDYRGKNKKPYLAISFVETGENQHTVEALRARTVGWVDEFVSFKASNQNGQLPGSGTWIPAAENNVCAIPFKKLYISWEGFVRVCCNDYENLLAIEDLEGMTLKEAFHSKRFQAFRKRHMENRLEGTLCHNCKNDCVSSVQPLRPELYFRTHKTDEGPSVSYSPKIFRKIPFEPTVSAV